MFRNRAVTLLIGMCILISGCSTTTPMQRKYQDLEALYKSGGLTANEYTVAKEKIMREEMEQAKAMSKADSKVSHTNREHGQ